MKIYLKSEEEIEEMIKSRKAKVCVVGLGTIGLPLATLLAKEDFTVLGYDVDRKKIDKINAGKYVFEYMNFLEEVIKNGNLKASDDPKETISNADIIFVCVPTPIDDNKNIDLKYIRSAAESLKDNMDEGAVVILESSVSIGVTRYFGKLIEENGKLKIGKNVGLAYCPERYNPGLPLEFHPNIVYNKGILDKPNQFTMDRIPRVIGGADKKSLSVAKHIYSKIIREKISELSSLEASEAVKLTENIFRDVNIALMNELAKIYSELGLNTYEIIEGAKTKPFAFLPHYPSVGVGGECIPVDTWYLIKQAEELNCGAKLMKTTREVNDSMPIYTISLLEEVLKNLGKKLDGSNVCVLGLSYKKNVADTRVSPSKVIFDELKEKNANVFICDPIVEIFNSKISLMPLKDAFKNMDAVIIATDHDIFKSIDLKSAKKEMRTPIIIDGRNFYNGEEVESLGFIYRGIGKPKE